MAYYFDESSHNNGSGHQVEFYADTVDDIASLPTSTTEGVPQGDDNVLHKKVGKGSSCYVINPSSLYILNSNDEWVEQ